MSDFSFKCVEHKEGGCHAAEGDDIDAKLMLKMESVELPELLLPPPTSLLMSLSVLCVGDNHGP